MPSVREYTVSFGLTAVTVGADLFELDAATDKPIEVFGIFFTQNTDFGEAQDELLVYNVIRGHTTSGSGGSTATPAPITKSDTAAGVVAETLNTTAASAGTAVTLYRGGFNVRAGEALWLPDGSEWSTSGADLLVVRLMAAPVDSISLSGTLYVREMG